jgi:DNA-binding HxlR family transcriptional regulator
MAGMARETISRQLTWLVREGIIERSKKNVRVLDFARLEALCDGTAIVRKLL